MRFKAVAFDVDGTLYANRNMYLFSIPFFLTHPRLVYHYGRVRREIRETRPIEDFYYRQGAMLAGRLGTTPEAAMARLERQIYEKWERVLAAIPPYPGVREAVEEIRRMGAKTAVLSDFPVHRKLEFLGMEGLWDVAFSAEETGYLKPNPEPFEELVSRLGLAPSQILYVGNSYRYDVIGSKRAGLACAHLSTKRRPESIADFTFSRYADLVEWIRRDPAEEHPAVE